MFFMCSRSETITDNNIRFHLVNITYNQGEEQNFFNLTIVGDVAYKSNKTSITYGKIAKSESVNKWMELLEDKDNHVPMPIEISGYVKSFLQRYKDIVEGGKDGE